MIERLKKNNLMHLANETDTEYVKARILEAEEDKMPSGKGSGYYLLLGFYEAKGLFGECLRLASKLGNDGLASDYEQKIRDGWKTSLANFDEESQRRLPKIRSEAEILIRRGTQY